MQVVLEFRSKKKRFVDLFFCFWLLAYSKIESISFVRIVVNGQIEI